MESVSWNQIPAKIINIYFMLLRKTWIHFSPSLGKIAELIDPCSYEGVWHVYKTDNFEFKPENKKPLLSFPNNCYGNSWFIYKRKLLRPMITKVLKGHGIFRRTK